MDYTMKVETLKYEHLLGGTSLNNGSTWDDPHYAIPLGFNFTYFNSKFSTIYLSDLGLGVSCTLQIMEKVFIQRLLRTTPT